MATDKKVGLRKETGGCTLTGPDGELYEWKNDKSVVQVPYEWALELLEIDGGGFEVSSDKKLEAAQKDDEENPEPPDADHGEGGTVVGVREPAPQPMGKFVTEPAPMPGVEARIAEPAQPADQGSKITPKQRAGTQQKK